MSLSFFIVIQPCSSINFRLVNITPVSGSDLTFGFGGIAVDLQKPGTIMVAPLNEWWPDANIFRSLDGGATWKRLWEWTSYPDQNRYYKYDDSLAPWLGPGYTYVGTDLKQVGWMIEALVIDPFDSDHWLYGTVCKRDMLNRLSSDPRLGRDTLRRTRPHQVGDH